MEQVRCTLCGSEKVTRLFSRIRNDEQGEYTMYRCACCETHFLYPRPNQEQLEDYYNGTFREEVHTKQYYELKTLQGVYNRFMPEAKQRVERVKAQLEKTDIVLEVGCSVGYFLDAIADQVQMVCGTEWDQKAQQFIRDCAQHSNIQVGSNPEEFNLQFDKIFLFHVLEHIQDPVVFLQNLKKVLNPGGKIYIEVPNVDDAMVKTYDCEEFKNFYYKKAHLYNFNEVGLSYLFQQAGYQYRVDYIQRYDLSNHLYWLGKRIPGGKGYYSALLGEKVNQDYVEALVKKKQTDTLFATIWE